MSDAFLEGLDREGVLLWELGQVQWNQSDVCEEGGKPTGEPQWGDPGCTPFLVIHFLNEKQDF